MYVFKENENDYRYMVEASRKIYCYGRLAGGPKTYKVTPSIPNYKTFDFFDIKFDHSSYSKNFFAKHHFFLLWLALLMIVL
jgi:hypothetical protein